MCKAAARGAHCAVREWLNHSGFARTVQELNHQAWQRHVCVRPIFWCCAYSPCPSATCMVATFPSPTAQQTMFPPVIWTTRMAERFHSGLTHHIQEDAAITKEHEVLQHKLGKWPRISRNANTRRHTRLHRQANSRIPTGSKISSSTWQYWQWFFAAIQPIYECSYTHASLPKLALDGIQCVLLGAEEQHPPVGARLHALAVCAGPRNVARQGSRSVGTSMVLDEMCKL